MYDNQFIPSYLLEHVASTFRIYGEPALVKYIPRFWHKAISGCVQRGVNGYNHIEKWHRIKK